jgi:hypothetical protein
MRHAPSYHIPPSRPQQADRIAVRVGEHGYPAPAVTRVAARVAGLTGHPERRAQPAMDVKTGR